MFRESKTNSNISTEYNLTKHSTFSTIETNQKRKEISKRWVNLGNSFN